MKVTCMTLEERLHLIDAVLTKIPEQVTRQEKVDFATGLIAALKRYCMSLGKLECKERLKMEKENEQDIDRELYNDILWICGEIWVPERCAGRTPEITETKS